MPALNIHYEEKYAVCSGVLRYGEKDNFESKCRGLILDLKQERHQVSIADAAHDEEHLLSSTAGRRLKKQIRDFAEAHQSSIDQRSQ